MKRALLSVRELDQDLGISADSVYRTYQKGEIPAAHINRMIRLNAKKVQRAMVQKTKAMLSKQCSQRRATGGASRRRAQPNSHRLSNTGD